MLYQHSPQETPLWIPYMDFDSKEQCVKYAQDNQNGLFMKAFQEYQMKIPPKQISCVNETTMKQIQMMMKMNEGKEDDKISL
tara:strand:+ start:229 stop:474 length:246 start_codon:yes stop_codon:yes gene_type:complete